MEWKRVDTQGKDPTPRSNHTMTYMRKINYLVIYGGKNNSTEETIYLNELNVLNLKNLNWLHISENWKIKEPRCLHCACEYNTQLIILGGINSQGYLNGNACVIEFEQNKVN